MINSKLKIYYIYHSGFAVETTNYFLIFDYYKECNNPTSSDSFVLKDLIKSKKNVLIFSSHSHHDHFNPVILDWEKYNQNIKYILSSDITLENWKNNYYKMSQGEDLFLKADSKPNTNSSSENKTDGVYVKAYGSTDIGVSFLVRVDGLNIFHAGDLNWWHWKEDSYEERKTAEENFKKEIDRIKGEPIDIAFFPVDPRLEEFYNLGAEYFIKELEPEILVPMHFGDNAHITKEFAIKNSKCLSKIVTISHSGEELEI
ncbi:MBL fold metallo-hydrolase [Clostridiaceae bacterium UIB06]|nr:MBL fold metallo-hydrolase [Clostridiaceae bacterium UIB06]